jgi:hypothetical protein
VVSKNLIDVRWVFKLKYKNGVFEKHRARIVAKGYLQKVGIDYIDFVPPRASHIIIRLVLTITACISASLQEAIPGCPSRMMSALNLQSNFSSSRFELNTSFARGPTLKSDLHSLRLIRVASY